MTDDKKKSVSLKIQFPEDYFQHPEKYKIMVVLKDEKKKQNDYYQKNEEYKQITRERSKKRYWDKKKETEELKEKINNITK